jgi:hypothetical protein
MEYTHELEDFDFSNLRKELYTRIEDQKTVDQNRLKITNLLTGILARVKRNEK